ncbi:MAG: filamentous hemagglutinin N-terminal domain-containing protein, partial [Chroococcidiopsidaceae cyanobacterium CP_BM_RX_35]|nr:filamentous hemagglutinin N-terminal domain-containing protein [Chroococcidiopsidaceae cyanobacterium CP_BM_RX_35]
MAQGWKYKHRLLVLISSLAIPGLNILFPMGRVLTQIVPDRTLGAERSVVTPGAGGVDVILGGTRRGTNLFHSFEQFSVLTGRTAYFNNAATIQNIISRVTGGGVSSIDGLIKANGTANLFLINPNGIVFGPNAALNVGGSFVGSTASSLKFSDGTEFSATAPKTSPLLTVSVPIGLQLRGNPGSILNQSQATDSNDNTVGLQVRPGQTLALVGGNINFNNGMLRAPGGRVELGGLAEAGTVGLNVDAGHLNLSFPNDVARADVSLTHGSEVNVQAGGGGSIVINAQNLILEGDQNSTVAGASKLLAGIASGEGSVNSQAGDIDINVTGAVTLNNESFIANTVGSSISSNAVQTGTKGKAGDVNVLSGSLSLTNGAELDTSTYGNGDAGSVTINVSGPVSFDGVDSNGYPSGAFSTVESGAIGKGGNVNVMSGSLSLTNGAELSALTTGNGDAGSVTINTTGSIFFDGVHNGYPSGAFSTVNQGAMGKGGDVNVTAGSLSLTNGGELSSSTYGNGDAGSVTINVSGPVSFDGVDSNGYPSGAFSTVES